LNGIKTYSINNFRFKVQGSRFKVPGSRFRVQGSGFKVQGICNPNVLISPFAI